MAFPITKPKSTVTRRSHSPRVISLHDPALFGVLIEGNANYSEIGNIIENNGVVAEALGQLAVVKFVLSGELAKTQFESQVKQIRHGIVEYLSNQADGRVSFIGYLGGSEFVILIYESGDQQKKESDSRSLVVGLCSNLKKQHGFEVAAGLEACGGAISPETRKAYQSCLQAICIGYGIWQRHYVYKLDDFELIPAVYRGTSASLVKKSRAIITKLSRHAELLDTLSAYFKENMNLTVTAQVLRVHRNTVLYRFGKIVELTDGLDPRNFDDAMQLRLAIIIDKVYG